MKREKKPKKESAAPKTSKTGPTSKRGTKTSTKPAASSKVSVKASAKPAAKQKVATRRPRPAGPVKKAVAAAGKAKTFTTKSKALDLKIPAILLEGDLPPAPKLTGPGARYALAPGPLVEHFPPAEQELPEGYGTQRLFLTARDPRWLYSSWDLTAEQQRQFNQRSRDGHLVLRVFKDHEKIPIVPDVHVHPESRTWFISVPYAETRYRAELGLYDKHGTWEKISQSSSTFTPPDAPSSEVAAEFATIPVQVSFEQVVEMVQDFVTEHKPLLEAVVAAQEAQQPPAPSPEPTPVNERTAAHSTPEVPRNGFSHQRPSSPSQPQQKPRKDSKARTQPSLPPIRIERSEPWTHERREALAQLISIDSYRRVWMGSIEITELVRRQLKERLQEEVASIAAVELTRAGAELPGAGPAVGVSSPYGGEISRQRKFWFKVNAELIIYGATEPDARVSIADRAVKLRQDGTFSFRFALPDGQYQLPTLAISGDGEEGREARLEFSRSTEYRGDVEAHPQDPSLRAPRPENL